METWNEDPGTRTQKKINSKSQVPSPTSLKLVVRPQLHCPEIDTYDEINLKQVLGTFEDKDTLDI